MVKGAQTKIEDIFLSFELFEHSFHGGARELGKLKTLPIGFTGPKA